MIIDFIIALAVYDSVKFILRIVIIMINKDKSKDEFKIQSEVRTFEQRIRKAMENK